MKKNVLIFCAVITTLSLTVYGFTSNSNSSRDQKKDTCNKSEETYQTKKRPEFDFLYEVDSRFRATITKDNLHNAKSIKDLVPEGVTEGYESFRDVKIGIVTKGEAKFKKGKSNKLNSAQLSLLKSIDHSTSFYIEAFCKRKNLDSGKMEDQCFVFYVTAIPEKEAEFKEGHLALMNYLEENSTEQTKDLNLDQLKPGKVHFTVAQNGEITNVKLESTSGYTAVDNNMIDLIKKTLGKWNPATNSTEEKVDQELVLFFGRMGC